MQGTIIRNGSFICPINYVGYSPSYNAQLMYPIGRCALWNSLLMSAKRRCSMYNLHSV